MSETGDATLRLAREKLKAAGVETPDRDARLLLRHVLGVDGAGLSTELPKRLDPKLLADFDRLIERRAKREPMSHIVGHREFWGRSFRVSSDVLDPRPETECLIAEALHRGPFRKVLDLGIGSGCILLTLLAEWHLSEGTGIDCSATALKIAKQNAIRLEVSDRCVLTVSDWYSDVTGIFDLIVSNPPYIAAEEMTDLSPEVRLFEPEVALTPGGDGLSAYAIIAERASRHLSPNGLLMVEIGPTQSHQVSAIFANAGLLVDAVIPDLDHRPRVIIAHM